MTQLTLDVAAEIDRRKPQAQRILDLLQRRGTEGATNAELGQVCQRFGGRLFELRQEGHDIRKQYVAPGLWRYWLVME